MHPKLLFLLICLKAINSSDPDEQLVDYYEQLITEEKAKSIAYQFPKDASEYRPTNLIPQDFGTFDFVVVGGGSAGAVVASRLSEVSGWSVLLLEAGKEGNNFTEIPSMSVYTMSSEYNWGFKSTRQHTCCLATGGVCSFPRGKALGGTSTLNALIYSRGKKTDFDKWGEENPGWSFDDVLPYFMKSEKSEVSGDTGYHGSNGYLNVQYYNPTSRKVDVFLEANLELGYPVTDVNGINEIGANRNHFTTRNGRRLDTAKAFLEPARTRTNLKILTESYVAKVLLTHTSDRVKSVLFSRKNIEYIVKVNKEVILSSGVVGSPHILMHSGIGPAEHLQNIGIPVKQNLAVGRNMHDHLFFDMLYLTPIFEPYVTLREGIKQYLQSFGPLTISMNPQGLGFYRLDSNSSSTPQYEILFVPSLDLDGHDGVDRGALYRNVNKISINYLKGSAVQNHIIQIAIVLLHPKTRGKIYLQSNDPYKFPAIESRCLADPDNEDIEDVYRAVQKVTDLIKTAAFKELNAVLIPYPSCLIYPYLSKEYWTCTIRHNSMNAFHGAGTCSMGPDPKKGAVVDNRLRVHGVSNLRVADATVIPATLSGHMNAPAIMIGERVADFIKEHLQQHE